MIGMDTAAWPDPEGMKKLSIVCTMSMQIAEIARGMWLRGVAIPFTTVSMIPPSVRTNLTPRAIPIIIAAVVASMKPETRRSPTF